MQVVCAMATLLDMQLQLINAARICRKGVLSASTGRIIQGYSRSFTAGKIIA